MSDAKLVALLRSALPYTIGNPALHLNISTSLAEHEAEPKENKPKPAHAYFHLSGEGPWDKQDIEAIVQLALAAREYVALPSPKAEPERKPVDWSMVRSLLMQGASIQQDYQAGKYANYEEYSARMDEAARERIAELERKEEL